MSNSLLSITMVCFHHTNLQPTREVVRPANQLALSEAELQEEVAKMLTANKPAAPQNLARFNMKERSYKFEAMVEQHVRMQPGNRVGCVSQPTNSAHISARQLPHWSCLLHPACLFACQHHYSPAARAASVC